MSNDQPAPISAKDLFEQQQEQAENNINEQADEHDRLLEAWLGE
jgi:hypothetical protein